jgi:hypothetical protein
MKKRDPLVVILLTLVTFGIYGLYWLYSTREEMVKKSAKIPPFWILLLPLLLFVAALLEIVVHFVSLNNNSTTVTITNGAAILLGVGALIGIPYSIYFMYKFCGGLAKVTRKRLNQNSCFLLFIVLTILSSALSSGRGGVMVLGGALGALWFGYIQNGLNKYAKK